MSQAMDRHRRMARTLGCLIASMTVGATLLDWGQPAGANGSPPVIELTAISAWSGIRIAPQWAVGTKQTGQTHFVVDGKGHCAATDHWVNQTRFNHEPVVRIYLIAPTHSNRVTDPQWTATKDLVSALQRRCNIPSNRIQRDDTLGVPAVASIEPYRYPRP